jgi:hypothetical protein
MKLKTNRRKKTENKKDLVSITLYKDRKCPSCGERKDVVIHFLHKDTLRNKRIMELLLCEDCVVSHRKEIVEKKDKRFFALIPILNSMLKEVGIFDEVNKKDLVEYIEENKKNEVTQEKIKGE